MVTQTMIEVRFQVKGRHRWPNAPTAVAFLRDSHRHTFHFRVRIIVRHDDRDVEFILFRDRCAELMDFNPGETSNYGEMSCEQLAKHLWSGLEHAGFGDQLVEIGVGEDGEFEGIVRA